MSIAQNVIEKCGGVSAVAQITGRTISVVHRWTYDKSKGGTGGTIPVSAMQKIMDAATRGEVDVEASDFFDDIR